MILPIIQFPDKRLYLKADPVPVHANLHHYAVRDLAETFRATRACWGLAANQLGMNMRMIIVDTSQSRCDTLVMINPEITTASDDMQTVSDGCMSVENGQMRQDTLRPKRIRVKWQDAHGRELNRKFHGALAAVIHHEIDHLDGRLFMSRAIKRKGV